MFNLLNKLMIWSEFGHWMTTQEFVDRYPIFSNRYGYNKSSPMIPLTPNQIKIIKRFKHGKTTTKF